MGDGMSTAHQQMIDYILRAADDHKRGKVEDVKLIADCLIEADDAKHHLRRKGYGYTGKGILATAQEVPEVKP